MSDKRIGNILVRLTRKFSKTLPVLAFLLVLACTPAPRAAKVPLADFLSQADTLAKERRYSEAVNTLEEAVQLYPDTPAPLIKIGQIYLKQHRWIPARDAFNRALAADLDNALATAGLAEATLNQGDPLAALPLWQKATELNPNLPGGFTGLGRTHLARFEFEQAKQAFLDQQAHRPHPEAQWYLAALTAPLSVPTANDYLLNIPPHASQELLARRDYLLATLVPFTDESPQVEVARASGIALVQAELWPLAVHALEIARQNAAGLPPKTRAEILSFLGHARAQSGRPAMELFEQAQQLDPASALPLYFYGIYLRRQKALRVAEDSFNRAIELDPNNAAIYIELARTRADQGDFRAAETLYATAVSVAEDNVEIQLARVRFHASRGYNMAESGIPAAQEIIEADENNASAYDLLGWMQFLTGETAKAEASLRRAIELDPELVSARYHLARYLETTGQSASAVAQYRRVVDWDTSGAYRDRALQDLQRITSRQE